MANKKKRWLWLLLLLIVIPFIIRYANIGENLPINNSTSPIAQAERQVRPTAVGSTTVEPGGPSYIPLSKIRRQAYSQEPEYILTGRVTSELGGPLPGTVVSLHSSKGDWFNWDWPNPIVAQTCDSDGRYTIRLRSPAHAYLRVLKEGFTQKEAKIDFVVPETIVMDHRLRPAPACIEGHILDQAGAPIPSALVLMIMVDIATAAPHSNFSPNVAEPDLTGKYTLGGLPEGKLRFIALSETHLWKQVVADVKAGGCKRVDIRLGQAFVLALRVKNVRGQGIPRAMATTERLVEGLPCSGFGDDQGLVKLAIPPDWDSLTCAVSAEGYKRIPIRIDPQAPPAEVVLEDEDAPLIFKGRVIDEIGQPVPNAKLQTGSKVTGTDNNGRFTLAVTSASLSGARIMVSKAGFIPQTVIPGYIKQPDGSLDGNNPQSDVIITMKPEECGFFGRVIDENGMPIKRYRIHIVASSGISFDRSFDSDDGVFSVHDIPAGTYDLDFNSEPVNAQERGPLRNFAMGQIEMRRGYYYGEFVVQLGPRKRD